MCSIKFKALSIFHETPLRCHKVPIKTISISPSPSPYLYPRQLTQQQVSRKLISHILSFSSSSINSRLRSTKSVFLNFLSEKLVVFLVGSFALIGCFVNARTCVAIPANKSSNDLNVEFLEDKTYDENEEEMYEKVLKSEPKNIEALKVIVYGKMRRGEMKEAVKYVERLIEMEPFEVEWRLLLAFCYEMMGNFSNATKLFKEILKERPLLVRALHGLALVMHKNHEDVALFEMLSKAQVIARRGHKVTEERNIRILIAQMHVVMGKLEEGLLQFQELVNENPRDFRPYLCQGIIYSLLNKKKEAEEQFEVYESLVPDEFPQGGFLNEVVLAAKTRSKEQLRQELKAEFSHKK